MYISHDMILAFAAVCGVVAAACGAVYKFFSWYKEQENQTSEINKLREQEENDIKDIKAELQLLTYALLGCLKGLQKQGCDGPVTDAISALEKHINHKAHN